MIELAVDNDQPEHRASATCRAPLINLVMRAGAPGLPVLAVVNSGVDLLPIFDLIVEDCAQTAELHARSLSDDKDASGCLGAARAVRAYGKTMGTPEITGLRVVAGRLSESRSVTSDILPAKRPAAPFMAFLDETGRYFGRRDDALRRQLRDLACVPNATYQVENGRIFVFEKLVQLAVKAGYCERHPLGDADARKLTQLARVTPLEAVTTWGVTPYPYRLEGSASAFAIVHEPFNAVLAGTFVTKNDAQKALAKVLVGEQVSGAGQFTHQGQPLTLRASLGWDELPPVPLCLIARVPAGTRPHLHLGQDSFLEGFTPINPVFYAQLYALENAWADKIARLRGCVEGSAPAFWKTLQWFQLNTLNDTGPWLIEDDYAMDQTNSLRTCFPELAMLTDATLYHQFDQYQAMRGCTRGWVAFREDTFLPYLIGKAGSFTDQGGDTLLAGQVMAYALMLGQSYGCAKQLATQWLDYNTALCARTHHVAAAMRYLASQKNLTDLRGPKISTMLDAVDSARSLGICAKVSSFFLATNRD